MRKPLVTIEDWAVVQRGVNLTYEDLQPGRSLVGNVFGHENLRDDRKQIYTSPILRVHTDSGLVETRNTLYQLGEASSDYKSWREARKPAVRCIDWFGEAA